MEKTSQRFLDMTTLMIAHTAACALTLFSIFLIRYALANLFGKDFLIFDSISLNSVANAANIFPLALYVWRIVRSVYAMPTNKSKYVAGAVADEKDLAEEPKASISTSRRVTVVELLADSKSKRIRIASFLLIFTGSVYVTLSLGYGQEPKIGILAIVVFFFLVFSINQKILTYRIHKGIYGTNEYEAREIITYILSNSDKEDFSDGDASKRLLLPLEQDVRTEPTLGKELGEVEG